MDRRRSSIQVAQSQITALIEEKAMMKESFTVLKKEIESRKNALKVANAQINGLQEEKRLLRGDQENANEELTRKRNSILVAQQQIAASRAQVEEQKELLLALSKERELYKREKERLQIFRSDTLKMELEHLQQLRKDIDMEKATLIEEREKASAAHVVEREHIGEEEGGEGVETGNKTVDDVAADLVKRLFDAALDREVVDTSLTSIPSTFGSSSTSSKLSPSKGNQDAVVDLEKEVYRRKVALNVAQSQIVALRQEITLLKESNRSLRDQFVQLESGLEISRANHNEAMDEISRLRAAESSSTPTSLTAPSTASPFPESDERSNPEAQASEVMADMSSAADKEMITMLESQVDDLQKEKSRVEKERDTILLRLEQLEQDRVSASDEELVQLRATVDDLSNRNALAASQLEKVTEEKNAMKEKAIEQIRSYRTKVKAAVDQINQLKSLITEKDQEVLLWKEKCSRKDLSASEQSEAEEREKEMSALESELEAAKSHIVRLRTLVEDQATLSSSHSSSSSSSSPSPSSPSDGYRGEDLPDDVSELKNLIISLQEEKASLLGKLEAANSEIKATFEEQEAMEERVEAIHDEKKATQKRAQGQMKDFQDQMAEIQSARKEAEAQVQEYMEKVMLMESKVEDAEEQRHELEAAQEQIIATRDHLQQRVQALEENRSKLLKKAKAIAEDRTATVNMLQQMKADKMGLVRENENLKEEKQKLAASTEQQKAHWKQEMERKLKELAAKYEEAQGKLLHEKAKLVEALRDVEDQNRGFAEQVAMLQKRSQVLEGEKGTLYQKADEKIKSQTQTIKTLTEELKTLQEQAGQRQALIANLEQQVKRNEVQLADAAGKNSQTAEEVVRTRNAAKAEIDRLHDQLGKTVQSKVDLQNLYDEALNEKKRVERGSAQLQSVARGQILRMQSILRKYVAAKRIQLKRMGDEIEARRKQEQQLKAQMEHVKTELSVTKDLLGERKVSESDVQEVDVLRTKLHQTLRELQSAKQGVRLETGKVMSAEQVAKVMANVEKYKTSNEELKEKVKSTRKKKNDLAKAFINLKKRYESILKEQEGGGGAGGPRADPEMIEKYEAMEEELKEAKERIVELEERAAKMKQLVAKANQRIQENKQTIQAHLVTIEMLEEKNNELTVAAEGDDSVSSEVVEKKIEEAVSAMRDQLVQQREESARLASELSATKSEFESYRVKAHSALQLNAGEMSKVSEYQDTIAQLKSDIHSLTLNEQKLNEHILDLQSTQATSISLTDQMRELQAENADLLTQMSENEQRYKDMNADLKRKIDDLVEKMDLLEESHGKEISELQEANQKDLEELSDKLKTYRDQAKKDLEKKDHLIVQLQRTLEGSGVVPGND